LSINRQAGWDVVVVSYPKDQWKKSTSALPMSRSQPTKRARQPIALSGCLIITNDLFSRNSF